MSSGGSAWCMRVIGCVPRFPLPFPHEDHDTTGVRPPPARLGPGFVLPSASGSASKCPHRPAIRPVARAPPDNPAAEAVRSKHPQPARRSRPSADPSRRSLPMPSGRSTSCQGRVLPGDALPARAWGVFFARSQIDTSTQSAASSCPVAHRSSKRTSSVAQRRRSASTLLRNGVPKSYSVAHLSRATPTPLRNGVEDEARLFREGLSSEHEGPDSGRSCPELGQVRASRGGGIAITLERKRSNEASGVVVNGSGLLVGADARFRVLGRRR